MPFSFYTRLSRSQQAVYRKSDEITSIRLPRAEEARGLVSELEAALASESRPQTQRVTERLIRALTDAFGIQAVRVQVLAARPHAHWGELHGLYEAPRTARPTITLWMRTAKQRRVVAFRTYLRTLLHEVGHHVDYTLLNLAESYHTEGFYKRESSLFHQLVPTTGGDMPTTMEEIAKLPVEDQLRRLGGAADGLARTIAGRGDAALSKRPDEKNWSAKEIICHLRDAEESFGARFQSVLAMDEPKFLAIDPDRLAEERQYARNDATLALEAFRRRRAETLQTLGGLKETDWQRAGVHATRGRMTIRDIVTLMTWHDENHLDQLRRALEGRA